MQILVDYSNQILPIRDQGPRPTCLAFAISDSHSYHKGINDLLSPEYLFYKGTFRQLPNHHSGGLQIATAIEALDEDGQPKEADYPYVMQDGIQPLKVPPNPFPHQVYKSLQKSIAYNVSNIIQILDSKKLPVLGLNLIQPFHHFNKSDEFIDYDKSSSIVGSHAVIAVGHGISSLGKKCLLVKNSWGSNWGHNGFGWITEDYIANYLFCVLDY